MADITRRFTKGRGNINNRFEGWYYKHRANGKSLAIIPGRARGGAFIQVVTEARSYAAYYDLSEYHKSDRLQIGRSTFSGRGAALNVRRPDFTLEGEVGYSGLTPIAGDIMGPFRFFPMECRHDIISMEHSLCGSLVLNGEVFDFNGGTGYIESDRGRSFPDGYTWVQCNTSGCSITASVARIPFYGLRFWGCICAVRLNGREYRLATYKGAKISRCEKGRIELLQGKYRLSVTVDTRRGAPLAAPRSGMMDRVIYESLSCPARFRLTRDGAVMLDEESGGASYEWAM